VTNPILALLGSTLFLPLLVAYVIAAALGVVAVIAGSVKSGRPHLAGPSNTSADQGADRAAPA
jgi:hypothetical protein